MRGFGLLLCWVCFCFAPASGQKNILNLKPYLARIHYHLSNPEFVWDDGEDSLENACQRAIKDSCSIFCPTPHSAMIAPYIDKYFSEIKRCQELFKNQLLIIPGIEFGIKSHFYAIGINNENTFINAYNLLNSGKQAEAMEYLVQNDIIIVAAHPDMVRIAPADKDIFGNGIVTYDYRFNWNDIGATPLKDSKILFSCLPQAIEFLNNGNQDNIEQTFGHLSDFLYSRPLAILGGSDHHLNSADHFVLENDALLGSLSPYWESMKRFSLIWAKSLSEVDVLNAIQQGTTCAYYGEGKFFSPDFLPDQFIPGQGINLGKCDEIFNLEFHLPASEQGWYRWRRYELLTNPIRYKINLDEALPIINNTIYLSQKTSLSVEYILELKTQYYYAIFSGYAVNCSKQ